MALSELKESKPPNFTAVAFGVSATQPFTISFGGGIFIMANPMVSLGDKKRLFDGKSQFYTLGVRLVNDLVVGLAILQQLKL